MSQSTRKLTSLFALYALIAVSGPVFGATFTVTSTEDPEVINVANCTTPGPECTLREALAASDADPGADTVVFDVEGPVYLTRMLTVEYPVIIDGGGATVIRVDQGYEITILPDRITNPETQKGLCGYENCPDLPVLQPTFESAGDANRPMLEMHGTGSVVTGLILDGSITPRPADLGVERIDFESDNSTNFFLFTIESDDRESGPKKRWPIAGGVRFVLPLGTAHVVGNTLRNFNDAAVLVEGTFTNEGALEYPALDPVVSDNVITGGAAGQPFTAADGIIMLWTVGAVVTDNFVKGFRNGLSVEYFVTLNATGNEFIENEIGFELAFGPVFGEEESVIDGNLMSKNLIYGFSGGLTAFCRIRNNDVHSNGTDPEMQGGMLLVTLLESSVTRNEVTRNSGFGIVIDGQVVEAGFPDFSANNIVSRNDVRRNGGAGIVILNNSFFNTIEYNDSIRNSVGVVAGFGAPPYPYANTYQWNTFERNSEYDVLDVDPVCNDDWIANEFGTVLAGADNCVE